MTFKIGETVVYPHHGACTIEDVTDRTVGGVTREYLKLKVHTGGLTIWVPSVNVEYVGVRDVTSEAELELVFGVLREPYIEEPTNWSRRFKANQEKLKSGEVKKVAEVVRDLWRRQEDRSLSAGEKRMLDHAIRNLRSEVALARAIEEESAEALIIEQLQAQAA